MVKDRLHELISIRKDNNLPYGIDETIPIAIDGSEAGLEDLLTKIAPLYVRIKELSLEVIELRKGLNQPDKREKVGYRIEDIKLEATSIYKSIQEVNGHSTNEYQIISRVARTHHAALVKLFSNINVGLADLQCELTDRHKNYVMKELKIIKGKDVEEDEFQNLLNKELFTKNILEDTKIAKAQLYDLQQRYDEMTRMEESITLVNSMFQSLALCVKEQGESVDRIENHVSEAKERVEQSKFELRTAQTHQTKARKKKICIFGIVIAIVVVLILIIVLGI